MQLNEYLGKRKKEKSMGSERAYVFWYNNHDGWKLNLVIIFNKLFTGHRWK